MPVLDLILVPPEFGAPWTGGAHVTLVALNRLSRADRAAMAESVAGGMGLPKEALDQLAKRTDGVPLFVEELTKWMRSRVSSRPPKTATCSADRCRRLRFPTTLQDALMARLDRLVPIKAILQAGACIGREFSFELLVKIANVSAQELSSALDQLTKADLIIGRGDPPLATYTFKHGLVQAAMYASLLRDRRSQIHARIAQVLVDHFERHQARNRRPPFDRGGTVRAGHTLLARSGTTGCQPVRQPGID